MAMQGNNKSQRIRKNHSPSYRLFSKKQVKGQTCGVICFGDLCLGDFGIQTKVDSEGLVRD